MQSGRWVGRHLVAVVVHLRLAAQIRFKAGAEPVAGNGALTEDLWTRGVGWRARAEEGAGIGRARRRAGGSAVLSVVQPGSARQAPGLAARDEGPLLFMFILRRRPKESNRCSVTAGGDSSAKGSSSI